MLVGTSQLLNVRLANSLNVACVLLQLDSKSDIYEFPSSDGGIIS